jgi:hypothetical protein
MLPLLAETVPTTVPAFTEALTRGLEQHGLIARQIETQASLFPIIDALRIDLSDAHLTRNFRLPECTVGNGNEVEIAQFELLASPIYFEKAALEVRLTAHGVSACQAMNDGRGCLVLKSAVSGAVSVQMTRTSLEALFHSLATEAAAKQGLEVRKTGLHFTQNGPRSVAFRAEVTVKIFVMSAKLALTGSFVIDDELNARISNLVLDGDAMVLKLAGGYARPYLARLEGRVFPLLAFAPGGLKLRDVELTAGDTLIARAKFGA